jgi:hypothetical protein
MKALMAHMPEDFFKTAEEHLVEGIKFVHFRVGQMKDEDTWTIWREERTHLYRDNWPRTKSEKIFNDIEDKEYADTLCNLMEGNVHHVKQKINAYEGLTVMAKGDDFFSPAVECWHTILVY